LHAGTFGSNEIIIFSNISGRLSEVGRQGFFQDITMLMHRVKAADVDNLSIWLKSLP
jgi:hypothetical protein